MSGVIVDESKPKPYTLDYACLSLNPIPWTLPKPYTLYPGSKPKPYTLDYACRV